MGRSSGGREVGFASAIGRRIIGPGGRKRDERSAETFVEGLLRGLGAPSEQPGRVIGPRRAVTRLHHPPNWFARRAAVTQTRNWADEPSTSAPNAAKSWPAMASRVAADWQVSTLRWGDRGSVRQVDRVAPSGPPGTVRPERDRVVVGKFGPFEGQPARTALSDRSGSTLDADGSATDRLG